MEKPAEQRSYLWGKQKECHTTRILSRSSYFSASWSNVISGLNGACSVGVFSEMWFSSSSTFLLRNVDHFKDLPSATVEVRDNLWMLVYVMVYELETLKNFWIISILDPEDWIISEYILLWIKGIHNELSEDSTQSYESSKPFFKTKRYTL